MTMFPHIKMTKKSGLVQFIDWLVARKLAVKTVQEYGRYYKLLEKELGEKDLTQNFLDRFVIKHQSNVTRSFLKNLFEFYEISNLEVPKIKGRRKIKKRKTLSAADVQILSGHLYLRGIRFGLMFDLSYYCALRREEVILINIKDFQLKEYSEDPSRSCKLLIHGKGSKERYVIVPPHVMKKLIDWLQNKSKINMDKRLFGVGKSKWNKVFKEAVKKLGSHNYTLHDLRRSRATYWINQGVDLVRVKERLGHSSVATTQRYVNLEEEQELKKWEDEF